MATIDPINVDECGVDSLNNGDHAEANIDEPTDDEITTGMLNETNLTIPISSSTEFKFIKDKTVNHQHRGKTSAHASTLSVIVLRT